MEQLFEFIGNHPVLVVMLILLVGALLFTEQRKGSPGITSQTLVHLMNQNNAVVVDVRETREFEKGHITHAINLPFAQLKTRMAELQQHQEKPVVLVDAMGQHSGTAGKLLKTAGLTQVMKLKGGMGAWQADHLPVIK